MILLILLKSLPILSIKLPYENGKTKYRYVVTALDRLHNESKAVKKKIKL